METKNKSCNCTDSCEFIVMSCSGASDVGQLSDLVARKLRDGNQRAMKCLAMVAADDANFIESCKNANVLVIDGCPFDCGKKIMEKAGLANYNYIRLSDWGYKKGQSSATPELIGEVSEKVVMYC
jgi:uncharacterized metal-binding protein